MLKSKLNHYKFETITATITWSVDDSEFDIHLTDAKTFKRIIFKDKNYQDSNGITGMTLKQFNDFVLKVHSFFKEAEQIKRSSKSG